ncbi:MAG: hypothetical protein VX693_10460, partial [Pseudomonadota bacterium]|nr:hypothetical protein [Pseudomonadota bacterium]
EYIDYLVPGSQGTTGMDRRLYFQIQKGRHLQVVSLSVIGLSIALITSSCVISERRGFSFVRD